MKCCNKCGKEINKNVKFCPYCGNKVCNIEQIKKLEQKSNEICIASIVIAILPIFFLLAISFFDMIFISHDFVSNFYFLPIFECPALIISLILAVGAKIDDSTNEHAKILIIIYSILLVISIVLLCIVFVSGLNELKNNNFY